MKLLAKFLIVIVFSFSAFTEEFYTIVGDDKPKVVELNDQFISTLPATTIRPVIDKLHQYLHGFGDIGTSLANMIATQRDIPVFSSGNVALTLVDAGVLRGGNMLIALQLSSRNKGQLRLIPYFTISSFGGHGTTIRGETLQKQLNETKNNRKLMEDAAKKLLANFPAKYKKDVTNTIDNMIRNVVVAEDLKNIVMPR